MTLSQFCHCLITNVAVFFAYRVCHTIFYYLIGKNFQSDEEWFLFCCNITLGFWVIQDFDLCKLKDLWHHKDTKWCKITKCVINTFKCKCMKKTNVMQCNVNLNLYLWGLTEKLYLIRAKKPSLLNKWSELISECRHKNKFYLANFKSHQQQLFPHVYYFTHRSSHLWIN